MNRKKGALLSAATVLTGLSLACGGTGAGNDADGTTKDRPIAGATSTSATAAPTSDPNSISGDGTFAVPAQVKPGSYRTVVPSDSFNCYYERLKDASGTFDSIIANNNGAPGSQQIVEIKKTDKYFKTQGCGTWAKIG